VKIHTATLLAVMLAGLAGCAASPAAKPSQPPLAPSTLSRDEKVTWSISFADVNGTSLWDPKYMDTARSGVEYFTTLSCERMNGGMSAKSAVSALTGTSLNPSQSISQHDAIVMSAVAATAYCPSHKGEFDALMNANSTSKKRTGLIGSTRSEPTKRARTVPTGLRLCRAAL
jgi:hypothetical protein